MTETRNELSDDASQALSILAKLAVALVVLGLLALGLFLFASIPGESFGR